MTKSGTAVAGAIDAAATAALIGADTDMEFTYTNVDGVDEVLTANFAKTTDAAGVVEAINNALNGSSVPTGVFAQVDAAGTGVEFKGIGTSGTALAETSGTPIATTSMTTGVDNSQIVSVSEIDITTAGGSQNAITIIDEAIGYIDGQRAS